MQQQRVSHFRWVIILLLFSITVINYIDRESISYAIDVMGKTFHFSTTEQGFILGSFGVGYVVTTLLGGIAADRIGPRMTMGVAVIFWCIAMTMTGFAMGFVMIFLSRILLGLAEGPNFPSMTRAIGDWLPKNERAVALSSSLIAVPIALAVGGPLVTQLMSHVSWRGMFFVLAFVALLWLPFWWRYFRNFPEASKHVSPEELAHIKENQAVAGFDETEKLKQRQSIKNLWKFLISHPTLLANYWAFFVFGYYLFFFMSWLPTYLEKHYHLHLTTAGLFTVLPWAFAAIMMWLVGYLSDYIQRKTNNYRWSRSYPIIISQFLAAICVIPIIFINDVNKAMFFISLAVGFSMCTNAAYYAVNIDIVKERVGTALGIMEVMFALAGVLAPVITGWLISVTGHFKAGFVLLTVLALSSVIVMIIFHQPHKAEQLNL